MKSTWYIPVVYWGHISLLSEMYRLNARYVPDTFFCKCLVNTQYLAGFMMHCSQKAPLDTETFVTFCSSITATNLQYYVEVNRTFVKNRKRKLNILQFLRKNNTLSVYICQLASLSKSLSGLASSVRTTETLIHASVNASKHKFVKPLRTAKTTQIAADYHYPCSLMRPVGFLAKSRGFHTVTQSLPSKNIVASAWTNKNSTQKAHTADDMRKKPFISLCCHVSAAVQSDEGFSRSLSLVQFQVGSQCSRLRKASNHTCYLVSDKQHNTTNSELFFIPPDLRVIQLWQRKMLDQPFFSFSQRVPNYFSSTASELPHHRGREFLCTFSQHKELFHLLFYTYLRRYSTSSGNLYRDLVGSHKQS